MSTVAPFSITSRCLRKSNQPMWEKKNPLFALWGSASVSVNLWWTLWSLTHSYRWFCGLKKMVQQVVFYSWSLLKTIISITIILFLNKISSSGYKITPKIEKLIKKWKLMKLISKSINYVFFLTKNPVNNSSRERKSFSKN